MDGEGLAGGAAPQGGICHAAGLYQRAAHCAHPEEALTGGRTDYILCFKSGGGLAREEIERSIDKALFEDLEHKIIGKPLIRSCAAATPCRTVLCWK